MITDNKEKIELIKEFLENPSNGRETQRALAVKLVLEGYRYQRISEILSVSLGFISQWVNAFNFGGINGLKSGYKGSKSYLTNQEHTEVLEWLIEQKTWDISELEIDLMEKYDVVYQSLQSYYQILKEAKISWQKGQQINPRYNEEVTQKKQEIAEILKNRREEIDSGKLIVLEGYRYQVVSEILSVSLGFISKLEQFWKIDERKLIQES